VTLRALACCLFLRCHTVVRHAHTAEEARARLVRPDTIAMSTVARTAVLLMIYAAVSNMPNLVGADVRVPPLKVRRLD